MRTTVMVNGLGLLPLSFAFLFAACTSETAAPPADAGPDTAVPDAGVDTGLPDAGEDVAVPDTGVDAPAEAQPDAAAAATLSVSLDPTLDIGTDPVKATSITGAELFDKTGTRVVAATMAAGTAVFDLTGVVAGDYFINVNADADDLVPTRIDDPTKNLLQRVGQQLRASMIGPTAAPVYRINTYSKGQSEPGVSKFSDGTPVAGEQPYAILTLGTPKAEFIVLGTAAALATYTPSSPAHPSNAVPVDKWLLPTAGQQSHGESFVASGAAACSGCHANYATKPATYAAVNVANGFCFQCHNGPSGDIAGFVDPRQ